MSKIRLIKKVKANLIRIRVHKLLGFSADVLIYIGYMLKLSKWVDQNKPVLKYNDFYNNKVKQHDRVKLYQFLLEHKSLKDEPISYLEFGVASGNSLKWWSENNSNGNTNFWGFDTFEGLPEKYGTYEKGVFTQEGNFPNIPDERINFVKGLFQDTLLKTIPKIDFSKSLIVHLDGDLYSSTLFTLTVLYPYLKKGDILLFDEFGVPYHEFKAFDDFIKSFYIKLEPIGAINNYLQMAFEIKDIKT
ncbi:MAG: class I SAM-dependent methyltransferase [Cyclobacteriaceae bacterium]